MTSAVLRFCGRLDEPNAPAKTPKLAAAVDSSFMDQPVPKWQHVGMAQVLEEPRKRITARVSDRVRDTLEPAAEFLGANGLCGSPARD